MKVCTYLRQTPLGQFKRLGVFFNETTIVDINLVWQKQFELDGIYDAKGKANEIAPYLLSKFLKQYQERSVEMLKESMELFKALSQKNFLKTNDEADLSFDL